MGRHQSARLQPNVAEAPDSRSKAQSNLRKTVARLSPGLLPAIGAVDVPAASIIHQLRCALRSRESEYLFRGGGRDAIFLP